ncbi:hypothetical protein JMUB6875_07630 [Nocardia sp. JMUB6875]
MVAIRQGLHGHSPIDEFEPHAFGFTLSDAGYGFELVGVDFGLPVIPVWLAAAWYSEPYGVAYGDTV